MPILVFPAPGSETAQQNLDRFSCFDIDFSPSGKNSNILRWSENFNNSQWRKQNNQITFTESFNFLDSYLYDTDGLISPLSVATKPSNDYSVLYIRSNAIALSQTVLVEPDTAYTLSFITGGEFNSNLKIRIFCNNTQSNIVATNVAVTTTNTRIQQSFVTSSSCYSVDFFLVDYGTEPQTVFITQPQLQTGNVFTEFYPTYDLGIFQQSAVSKPSRGSLSFFVDNLYNWDPIASVTGSNLFGYSTIDSYINDDDLFIANIASTTSTKILYHNSLTRPYLPTRTVRLQNQNQTLGQYTVVASQNDSITIETSDNLAFTDGMTIIPTYGDLTTENRLRYLYSNDLLRNYNSLNRFFLEAYYPVRLFDRIKFNLYERIGQPSNFRPPNFAANVKLTQDYRVVSDKLQITARHNISGQSSLIDATLFRRGAINAQIWRNFVGLENRLTERMYVPQVRLFFDSFRVARDFTKIKFLENRIQDVSLSRLFKSFSRVNPIRINSMPVRNTILNNLYYKFIGVEPKTIIRSSNIISTTQSFTSENISSIISTPPSSSTAVTQLLISNLLNFLLPAGNLNVNIAAVTTRSTPENIAVYSNVALGQPAQVVGTDIFINNILDNYLFDSDILTYSTAQKSTQTFSVSTELEEPMPAAYFDGRNSLVETEPTNYFTVPSGSIEMNIMPDITRNNQVILSVYRDELVEFLSLDDVLIQPSGGVITEYIGDYAVFVFSVNSTFFIKPNQNYKNFYDAEVLLVGGGGGGGGNFTGANGGGGGGAVVHMTRVPISPNVLYSIKIGAGGTGGSGTAGGNGETTEAFGAIAAGGGGGGTYPTGNGIGGAVSSSGGAGANDVGGTLNTSANTFDTISKLAPLSTGVIYTGQVGGSLTGVRTGTTTRGAGGGGAGGSAQNTNPNLAGSAIGYGTAGSGGPGASINILNRICYFGGGGGGGGYLTTAGNGGFGGGGGGGAYATGSGVFNGFNGYGSYLDTTIVNLDPAGASRSGLSLGNAGTAMSGGGGGGGGGGGVGGGAGGNGCVMVKIQYRKNNVYDILLTSSLLSAITTTYPITLEILMVGGGGAGNGVYLGGGGGGGGAGGVLYTSGISVLSNTSYDITIGGGGAAAPNGSIAGASGGSTSINLGGTVYTAQGGGRHDSPGGSGGGRSNDYGGPFAATQNSPAPFNGYGSNGGDGSRGPGGSSAGGGGGGAGGVGASTVYIGTGIGGNGGIGIANNITGTLTYYAGGGGGGSEGPQQGTGGTGGGGRGGSANTGISPDSGLPNTGGGGGGYGGPGGVGGTIGAGGSGGSGVMIFRMSNNYSAQFSTGLLSSLNTNIAGYSIYTVTGGTGTVRFV